MKKFASAALCSVLALAMAGCSASTDNKQETTIADDTKADAQTLYIGISPDYPPYESVDTQGNIEGFDPDMVEWLFAWLNENGHNYNYEWEVLDFDNIITSLQADQVQLGISGFTWKEDRQGIFSDPYYTSSQVIVVTEDSDITSKEDLSGKAVGAQQGTTGEDAANSIDGAQVTAVKSATQLMQTLKSHGLDAVILDKAVADNYVANGEYKIVGEALLDEENIIYTTEANQELMDQMNEAIAAFKASDDYQVLVEKWFGSSSDAE